ncbi:uracil-DNA glycosylase [Psychrobacillus glaciei]|uniref:Uracil-DNA glycosylase n=1 Tax=Psychrobacillus glaciei TaxID=2283160 RepID=A0A5J6SY43_9BACI|nr:uracil-DNA glycosylase [Psychrobacillus glaciei]QFG01248.1 uracil-DNA glycosylase [Psychrobacillus glaciei]
MKRIEGFPVEGFVKGKGPKNPAILLIGEAPGENEAIHGIPFIGRAGDELEKSLKSVNLTRDDVYMTSAVRSRPYMWKEKKMRNGEITKRKYNRPPTKQEITAHAPLLDFEIKNIAPLVLVTLGNVGLQRLLGKDAKVSNLHGQVLEHAVRHLASLERDEYIWSDEKYRIIPTYHPAAVFYRPSNRDFIEEDWRKIGKYVSTMKY